MTLSQLLQGVAVSKMFQTLYGKMVVTHDVEIRNVQYDSRQVQPGDMFIAISGSGFDGHNFIADAVHNGAKACVLERDNAVPDALFMHAGVVKIVVSNTRMALAKISANYYRHPADRMTMIGVTGTNGKTTTTHIIRSILEQHGNKTGLIGTIAYSFGNETIPATHTTPESLELQQLLSRMSEQNCASVVMEVSSHALHQHRVEEIPFKVGVFTNLTQDHLDYHRTMEEYFEAKKILFDHLSTTSTAVINVDDEWGRKLIGTTKSETLSYGIDESADIRATNISLSMQETSFTVIYRGTNIPIVSSLIGRFNISNLLAAVATGIALNVPTFAMQNAVKNVAVRGRFERIIAPNGWTAIIDYAHTPDALQKALMAVQDIFRKGSDRRIITVFGCGGNRDRTKRPIMGAIATEYSAITVITSDNPRHENPESIIDEVMKGVKPGSNVLRESNRRAAIFSALALARKDDVVLIAGKGHEDYQVVGDKKVHFSDRETVEEFIRLHP